MHQRNPHFLPPIPGTGTPPRGLFVSRWGALLERTGAAPPASFADVRFAPHALELLFRAGQAGWTLYLVGNEDHVARGRWADAAWQAFESSLLEHVRGQGIRLMRQYACVDHPEGKGAHKKDSVFRFPNTGVLYHAAQEDGIELRECWIVSDDVHELAAGWRAGIHVAAIQSPASRRRGELEVEARVAVNTVAEALEAILTDERVVI